MNGTKSIVKPFRGAEFMLPMIGFYCHLCQEMSGDSVCAEDHVRSLKHNAAYQVRINYSLLLSIEYWINLISVCFESSDYAW